MYILVQHTISNPTEFWSGAEQMSKHVPPALKIHHTFPTKDGTRAVCVWEGDSIKSVRDFLEPQISRVSKNEYFQVENKESIAMPSGVSRAHATV